MPHSKRKETYKEKQMAAKREAMHETKIKKKKEYEVLGGCVHSTKYLLRKTTFFYVTFEVFTVVVLLSCHPLRYSAVQSLYKATFRGN